MAIENASGTDINILTVLDGALTTIRSSPLILVLFLLSGVLQFVLSPIIDRIARVLLMSIGIVVAYQALGGEIRADSSFVARLLVALIVTVMSYLPLIVGIVIFTILFLFGGTVLGLVFLVFSLPVGLYVYIRLFLSTPAVMIDGSGPAEALSGSWEQTNGSVLTIAVSIIIVVIIALVILFPVLWNIRSPLILDTGGTLIVDTLIVSIQAFLYSNLSNTNRVPQPN
jgi:membrane-anchored glycerophosphoryl diester phosphodiesterase (GDPDase)